MKRLTVILLTIIGVVQGFLLMGSLWSGGMVPYLLAVLLVAGIVYGAGAMLERVFKTARRPDAASGLRRAEDLKEIWDWRVLLVLVLSFILSTILIRITSPTGSLLIIEGSYYLVIILAGVALGGWVHAKGYVPVLGATLILLTAAIWEMIAFTMDADISFRFGPETMIFALNNLAARLNMLVLDIVVMYSAWRVTLARAGYAFATVSEKKRQRPVMQETEGQ